MCSPQELPGLTAHLDKLCHHLDGAGRSPGRPHAFIYFITITNASEHTVQLLGRKWVLAHADGTNLVLEGERIVGETPRLAPGESFSYNSYHVTSVDAVARGSFFGLDEEGRALVVPLAPFALEIPHN